MIIHISECNEYLQNSRYINNKLYTRMQYKAKKDTHTCRSSLSLSHTHTHAHTHTHTHTHIYIYIHTRAHALKLLHSRDIHIAFFRLPRKPTILFSYFSPTTIVRLLKPHAICTIEYEKNDEEEEQTCLER